MSPQLSDDSDLSNAFVLLHILGSLGVGYFGHSKGRNPILWCGLSVIITPLLAGLAIAVVKPLDSEENTVSVSSYPAKQSTKKYAHKTCNICGLIDIQPNMVRQEKKTEVATSRRGVGWRDILGTAAGYKVSERALRRSLFTTGKRKYTRKSVVWMCKDCARKA